MSRYPCQGAHRREFLRRSTAVAAGAAFAPRLLRGEEPAKLETPASADVGIARGSTMEEATRKAVALAGGLDFIQENQTVLIKPNCTGAIKNPTTTSPEVLYAVIKLINERGPKRIIVSDRPFSPLFVQDPEKALTNPKTIDVMKRIGHVEAVNQAVSDFKAPVVACGLEDAAREFELMGLPADTPMWRHIKPELATHWPNGFELAELLFRVDHVINVPVVKTHFQAWFTMSMKAFVGMSHHRTRREFHSSFHGGNDLMDQKSSGRRRRRGAEGREQDVQEVSPLVNRVAELNLGVRPAMNILDATSSFVFGGPSHGDSVDPKLVIASRDRIAADATGVAVLKHYGTEYRLQKFPVWENPFLRHGMKIGLGIDSLDKLHLKDSGLDEDIVGIREMLA